jgi:hypothetical protein
VVSSKAATVADYLAELEPARRAEIEAVRNLVNAALPAGYVETMGFGMISWVIPLTDYPDTYNRQPLAYAALAAQKNANSLYLNCVYASDERTARLRDAWAATGKTLDMGKSCIRFKRAADLAQDVVAAEISATPPADFIALYDRVKPPRR